MAICTHHHAGRRRAARGHVAAIFHGATLARSSGARGQRPRLRLHPCGRARLVRERQQPDHPALSESARLFCRLARPFPEETIIVIEGSADRVVDPAANRRLSSARARAVERFLDPRGVHPGRTEVRGIGEKDRFCEAPTRLRRPMIVSSLSIRGRGELR
ncbi:hypothetical protein E2493_20035 [Sphingomonas parva]|uniref:OmpA-like domain-containing protein n=1 Tax=Sphingomonas parva TaxID=2555898 RepID=A0A4Y8ZKE7_9SPHN|nr:hypothetical protein E2493_20035 [Sphingomonas parva]